jgi:hypothetical protein
MCSITDGRLALIGTAIDELAEAARVAAGDAGAGHPDTGAQDTLSQYARSHDALAKRVAVIWAMVADLDPALAHRVSQYTGQPTTAQATTGQGATGQGTPDPGYA